MCTPVYLKMNAHDPLLLSEGVCHQLGILKYHPDVKPREEMPGLEDSKPDSATEVPVPMVCVQLVKSTKVLPQQSTAVSVKLHGCWSSTGLGVLEADLQLGISGLCMEPSLMEVVQDEAQVIVTNPTGFTQRLEQGFHLGTLEKAKVVFDPAWVAEEVAPIQRITTNKSRTIGEEKRSASYFRMLYPYQRRRANFWHFSWTTTNPFYWRWVRGVRQRWWSLKSTLVILPPRSSAHTACLLSGKKSCSAGVVQPSNTPWASPVVLIRKKDSLHKFCVDYWGLNEVTRSDTFPLPRIDDLLDQLGEAPHSTRHQDSGKYVYPKFGF